MKTLSELINKYGPTVTAKEAGVRSDHLKERADRGAIVVNGVVYIPSRNAKGGIMKINTRNLQKTY